MFDVVQPEEAVALHGVSVKVVLFGEIRHLVGTREVDLALPAGSTIHTVGRELGRILGPEFSARYLTSDGAVQAHVAVFLNGLQLQSLGSKPAPVEDGQMELMLVTRYEGG